ncbi:hypothetical protein E0W58_10580 [Neisseria meningitidis]|nr:hypothetical protein [Neisseria meningitidis]MBR7224186.1 hypothetical protein [Neisseria meningitidis]MBR7226009.1 hypothetical protein [Neisseria meningitidis]MCG8963842.1 hypothetical protein [Neisseria meningitidis]MCG8973817.1 hypothetical protein [Neisseria meningitidis]
MPTKVGIQFFEFQSFPINCLSIECLDSRLRGNDESIRTETCTASFPRTYIPSFPQKWESRIPDFQIIFEYYCCSKV